MKEASKRRAATAAERQQWKNAVAEETAPETLKANRIQGQQLRAAKLKQSEVCREVLQRLLKLKDDHGLSLQDLQNSTGMTRGNLSRLFSSDDPNVTVETLARLAEAVHADLQISVLARD